VAPLKKSQPVCRGLRPVSEGLRCLVVVGGEEKGKEVGGDDREGGGDE